MVIMVPINVKDIPKLKLNLGGEALEKVYNFLRKEKKAYNNEEIARETGINIHTVRAMTKFLASEGKVKRVKRGRFYYYYC